MNYHTITVAVPEGVDPGEWKLTRAILETIHAGAGGDCLDTIPGPHGKVTRRHHRLDVEISTVTVMR